jgi:type I restriction enzyme S subunit
MITFDEAKIRDVADVKGGKRLPKGKQLLTTPNSHPYIRIRDLGKSKILELNSDYEYVDSLTQESIKRYIVSEGDILISVVGTIGLIGIVGKSLHGANQTENCDKITNLKRIDRDYLYYYLKSDMGQNEIKKGTVGAVQPKLPLKNVLDLKIKYPDIDTQRKIAKILNLIDGKITINNEINDNLCEQIKATYKRIINGSNNLKVTRIGDLPIYVTDYVANGSFASLKENVTLYQEPNYAYFIRNTDLKSGNFDVYVDEHSYNFLSKSTLKGKEIIISNVGDVGSVFLCPKLNKPMTLGNNVIMIEPEDEKLRYYLYSLFKWFDGYNLIQGIKGGSAVPKFNKTDFKNIKINLPLEKELEEFNNFVSPYFEKLIQNQDANKRLSELRDSLLPKLMSGEIDVDSIEL